MKKLQNWYEENGKFIAVYEIINEVYQRYNKFILFLYEKYKEQSEIWEAIISNGKVLPKKFKINSRVFCLLPSKTEIEIYDTKQDFMI